MQLEEFLERSANRFPDKPAVIFEGRRFTYGEVEGRSNRAARALSRLGVERGDRVAVFLDNGIDAVVSIFGILKAGAVFLMVNPTTKAEKLAYILNDCRATALITHAQKLETAREAAAGSAALRAILVAGGGELPDIDGKRTVSLEGALDAEEDARPPRKCIDIDLAALVYTSGSTGNPKGVMLTHLNMVSAATSITTYLENTEKDIILDVLPLSFDYGLYQVIMAFKFGGTVVIERSFTYPKVVIDRIIKERVTGFPILPTILSILFQMDLTRYDFSSLRYITNTGAALPTTHISKLRELFPHVKIFSMYGLTECKRVSYLPPDQIDIRPTSVGRGMPNEEVYIVDEKGNRVGPGVVGELVIRGSNVMKGSWGMPEETDRVLRPGPLPYERALHSGDLFRADAEGYLYFVGRKDDIIKSRGEKVSPKEVENVLHAIEGVAEAAVVGVPSPVGGESVWAFVRLKENQTMTVREVLDHCRGVLELGKIPSQVRFVSEFPCGEAGKSQKFKLRAAALEERAGGKP